MIYPLPHLYKDWKGWAQDLVNLLQRPPANEVVALVSFTVATLPRAPVDGLVIFVSDEAGGAIPAFSLGGAWRRFSDRAVVS